MDLVKAARRQRELLIQCDQDNNAQCFICLKRVNSCTRHLKAGEPKLTKKQVSKLERNKVSDCVKCRKRK